MCAKGEEPYIFPSRRYPIWEKSKACLRVGRPPEVSLDDIESKRDEDMRKRRV